MTISIESWQKTVLESQQSDQVISPHGDTMPRFPDEAFQRNTTGLDGTATVKQAIEFYRDVMNGLQVSRSTLTPASQVLDFGVGWGRISRVFLRDVPLKNIRGIDVDSNFVNLTRSLFHDSENFSVCSPFPPTTFADASVDLVVAYSVFSHLSEAALLAWVEEFARILRPGGHFAFTTRHGSFFDYLAWAKSQGNKVQGYLHSLGALFPDIEAAKSRYHNGELVFGTSRGVSGGGARTEAFYGETFIPQAYVERKLCDKFSLAYSSFDGTRYDQACFVLKHR